MNTFQLSCFLQVAETLNFARAAEILHVTQPAVTQQIRSLEKELGVPLFHRTTRSVKLTQARAASTASWPACRSTVFSPRVRCRKT